VGPIIYPRRTEVGGLRQTLSSEHSGESSILGIDGLTINKR